MASCAPKPRRRHGAVEGGDKPASGAAREGNFLALDFRRNHRREEDEMAVAAPEIELLRELEDFACGELEYARACPVLATLRSGIGKLFARPEVCTG